MLSLPAQYYTNEALSIVGVVSSIVHLLVGLIALFGPTAFRSIVVIVMMVVNVLLGLYYGMALQNKN